MTPEPFITLLLTLLQRNLANFAMFASNEYVLSGLFVLGFYSKKRNAFCRTLYIVLFTMILSTFLKSFFKIPYSNPSFTGYAFPSGHMLAAIAFWGWLAWELQKRWFSVLVFIILPCIAFALIYLDFHTLQDVYGAVVIEPLVLMTYSFICHFFRNARTAYVGFTLSFLAIPVIYFTSHLRDSVWISLGSLLAASIATYLYDPKKIPERIKTHEFIKNFELQKIIISFLGAALLYYPMLDLKTKMNFIYYLLLQSFILTFWMSYAPDVLFSKRYQYTQQK